MNYHPDDFLNLVEEAESQGGVHLSSEEHRPQTFWLDLPIDASNPTGPKRSTKIKTVACHRRAQFLVPLLPEAYFLDEEEIATSPLFDFDDDAHPGATMATGEPAMAKVCAVDDAMGLWPRFQGTMQTGQSFEVS